MLTKPFFVGISDILKSDGNRAMTTGPVGKILVRIRHFRLKNWWIGEFEANEINATIELGHGSDARK